MGTLVRDVCVLLGDARAPLHVGSWAAVTRLRLSGWPLWMLRTGGTEEDEDEEEEKEGREWPEEARMRHGRHPRRFSRLLSERLGITVDGHGLYGAARGHPFLPHPDSVADRLWLPTCAS
ncbi:hypothetical protein MAPG_06352 [Magnaporthiopsis poae ATCC 64411]|uniref:Uncharacterized protein n=1 Tax=Magnaporthiopsis poae (strain ATCC 64411 / 73-15) TaxID=644358 RepID=A0A0C4E1T3_MAGP6|nr:hypothetical protein MAPG_06352 [Magnaporthiopsis poae ATCC 64411]